MYWISLFSWLMVLLAISCYLLLGVAENLVASALYFRDYQLALVILHGDLSCGFSITWSPEREMLLSGRVKFVRNSKQQGGSRVYIRTRAMFWCWLGRDSWCAVKGLSNLPIPDSQSHTSVDKVLGFNITGDGYSDELKQIANCVKQNWDGSSFLGRVDQQHSMVYGLILWAPY